MEDDYLQITGRPKEMIIRGGSNIYPREIEDVLAAHPVVDRCAIFGLSDPVYGERVGAAIRVKPGQTAEPAALTAFLRDKLSSCKVPRQIFFVDEMPISAMNKTQKKELQRQIAPPLP